MISDSYFLHATLESCTPEIIDQIWADGWRNFGTHFFRNQLDYIEDKEEWVRIIPLRIDLMKFSFRNHQKKLLRKQESAIKVVIRSVSITPRIEELFQKHTSRFKHNIPESIHVFLGENPEDSPIEVLECALYDEQETLFATSYFGIGEQSISSIYALFDIDFSSKSPGTYTLLQEILYAQSHNKRYVYLGYAHEIPSYYDYKKNFNGLQYYDWQGNWLDFVE